jgi:multidrug efflux pump subunit AcrA (membrane-fusion protein)
MEFERTKRSPANRAGRALGILIAAMLAVTLIGRGVDSVTLPVVKAARLQSGPLKHIAEMTGKLTPREEIPVNARSGLTVSRVLVRPGQHVKAGEKLVEFDVSRLSKLLSQKQADLSKRKLQSQLDVLGDQSAGAPQDGKDKPKDGQQDPSIKQKAALKAQIASLEIAALQSDADELSSILYGGACATAPEAGTITDVIAKPGDLTQEGALIRLAPAEGGLVARASLEADRVKILAAGAAATYMLSGDTKYRDGATVLDIESSEDGYEISVALPDEEGTLGQTVAVRVEQDTGSFGTRVPSAR